jgi:hypothetical protein
LECSSSDELVLCPTNKLQNDCHSRTGVQCKDAWIPACAGMTGGQYSSLFNIFLENTSGTQHKKWFQNLRSGPRVPHVRDYMSILNRLRMHQASGRSAVALLRASGYGGTSRESAVPPRAGVLDGVLKPLLKRKAHGNEHHRAWKTGSPGSAERRS